MAKGIVTINTDAGFYPYDKVGSYAYWIKADGLFLKGSGVFKDRCKNPLEAEQKAIINALHLLESSQYKAERIIVNRDNIYAKSGKQTELGKMMSAIIKRVKKFSIPPHHKNYTGVYVEFRHVKAHNGTPDARSFVNDWCDKQCKEQLRKWKSENNKNIGTTQ